MEPTCRCHRGRSNSPLPAQQCCPRRAGLPAQCGSSLQRNDAGVWLCEYPGLSFQRSPVCACSLVSSLLLSGATMSQQSSLTQSAHSVRPVLTAYSEDSIAELCRKEGINQNLYYRWSKEFLEAGKKRLAGDTAREATSDEVKELKAEARQLKETLAEVLIENRLLKKSVLGDGEDAS